MQEEKTKYQLDLEEKKTEIMKKYTPMKKDIIIKAKKLLKERLNDKTISSEEISLLLQLIDYQQKIEEWEELSKIKLN